MTMAELVRQYEALGVRLWLDNGQLRFRAPAGVLNQQRLQELRFYKAALLSHLEKTEQAVVTADPDNRYAPFPLTDIQAAYLIGRKDDYELGGVGCHGYVELTMPVLDGKRLEAAWHAVIMRHDMLRAVVSAKGYQQVLKEIRLPPLREQDLGGKSPAEIRTAIEKVRRRLATRQYAPDEWPLCELFLTTTRENSTLHFSIDMLIADFVSIRVMLEELDFFYHQPEGRLAAPEVSYRDVILFLQVRQQQAQRKLQRKQDRDFWLERIERLPEAPKLPVAEQAGLRQPVSFSRHSFQLEPEGWDYFCRQAKARKITPSSAVLAAYARSIAEWSGQVHFCLTVTLLNRPELQPPIGRVIGDFTTVSLLEVSIVPACSFARQAQALQQQLWLDLEHGAISGIEVLREMRRRRGRNVLIPVVYTSTLGAGAETGVAGEFMTGARLTYGISQTPQVWIDCQVAERSGRLQVNWDVRDGVFPGQTVEKAFAGFARLLESMAEAEEAWEATDGTVITATFQERERAMQ